MGILLTTFEASSAIFPSHLSPFTPLQLSVSAVYKIDVLRSLLGYLPDSEILEAILDNSRSFHPGCFLILPFQVSRLISNPPLVSLLPAGTSCLPAGAAMGLAPRCFKSCSIPLLCGGERMDPKSQVLIAVSKL